MRVVKDARERRNEILDHAIALFVSKGYDHTSVEDIVKAIGIAKGTLYYHFKSKEEILDGIIDQILDNVIAKANCAANSSNLNVHEKILNTLLAIQVREVGYLKILKEVHKPQNALLHSKMLGRIIRDIPPILSNVVEKGVQEGIFHTKFPYESAELFITYGNVIFDCGFIEITEEELKRKIKAFITNIERVVGVESGSMSYIANIFETMEDIEHE